MILRVGGFFEPAGGGRLIRNRQRICVVQRQCRSLAQVLRAVSIACGMCSVLAHGSAASRGGLMNGSKFCAR